MNRFYEDFFELIKNEDKERSVQYVLGKLESGEINIVELYEEILAPTMRNMSCTLDIKDLCIWQEHIRSSIIRTIIECCYPYVIKEKNLKFGDRDSDQFRGIVMVICPSEEYHELGARMVADFFTICGYKAIFVGSNTPKHEFLGAISYIRPNYIALSVTNYYNLVAAKAMLDLIDINEYKDYRILVGGQAFTHKDNIKFMGKVEYIETFRDIAGLGGGEVL